jgi:hypothetical protein
MVNGTKPVRAGRTGLPANFLAANAEVTTKKWHIGRGNYNFSFLNKIDEKFRLFWKKKGCQFSKIGRC